MSTLDTIPYRPPEYDETRLITYGGSAGTYEIFTPWRTPAEIALVTASIVTAGQALLSPVDASVIDVTQYIAAAGTNGGGLPGVLISGVNNSSQAFSDVWIPWNQKGSFVVYAGAKIYLSVCFRRMTDIRHFYPPLPAVRPGNEADIHKVNEQSWVKALGEGK